MPRLEVSRTGPYTTFLFMQLYNLSLCLYLLRPLDCRYAASPMDGKELGRHGVVNSIAVENTGFDQVNARKQVRLAPETRSAVYQPSVRSFAR